MLKLYQFEISPFCEKVKRVMNVKKVSYEVIEVPMLAFLRGQAKRLSPANKLPAIQDGDVTLADSTDIVEYLEEKYPEPHVFPIVPEESAMCHVLEDWADESLYFYEFHLRFGVPANAKQWAPELLKHDPAWFRTLGARMIPRAAVKATRAQGLGRKSPKQIERDLARHVDAIDGLLGDRRWLVGKSLTIADIAVFTMLRCIGGTPEGEAALARQKDVRRWMKRVDEATMAPVL
jgi:glutathione S-transferase